jgi:hypothetical protein
MDGEAARKDGIPIADGDENTGHVVFIYIMCVRRSARSQCLILKPAGLVKPCQEKRKNVFYLFLPAARRVRLHKTTIYLLGSGKTINNDKRTHTPRAEKEIAYNISIR